jgi:hypothetical protein
LEGDTEEGLKNLNLINTRHFILDLTLVKFVYVKQHLTTPTPSLPLHGEGVKRRLS